uniref:Uncharacterized protein n=1 Tax=Schlesneria paludicola TaxID=360056 RepID=A0A7C2NW13_9PLAN
MRSVGLNLWSMVVCIPFIASAAWGGGQPTQQVLKILPNGDWALTGQVTKLVFKAVPYTYTVKVPVTVTKTVEVDGVTKEVQETQYREEVRTAEKTRSERVSMLFCRPVDPQTVKAFETDGRPISTDEVARRCQGETLVVVSADDEMIPDYYATVFKPGTIILALPPQPVMAPPPPGFAPQPVVPQPAPQAPPPPTTQTAPASSLIRPVSQRGPTVSDAPQPAEGNQSTLPSAPAPELVFVSRDGADAVKIRQFEESQEWVELTIKANDSSIAPEKLIKAKRLSRHSDTTSVPWSALRVGQAQGGDLPVDRAKEKLGQGETTAVMSVDGAVIDAFWLQNLKPSVLVLRGVKLPHRLQGHGYALPMSAPAYPAPAPHAPPAVPVETPRPPA